MQRPRHDRGGSCRWWATSRTSRPPSGSLTLTPTLTLARALDLALGPRPNRNPKQAAELLPHKTPSQIALLALCCKISSAARGRCVAPCGARYLSWGEARRKRLQVRRKSTKTRSSPRRFWNSRSRSSILNGAPVRQLAMLGSRLSGGRLGSSGFCRCFTLQAGRGLSHAPGRRQSYVSVSPSPLSSPPSPPPLRLRTPAHAPAEPCTRTRGRGPALPARASSRRPTPPLAVHPTSSPSTLAPTCRHPHRRRRQ